MKKLLLFIIVAIITAACTQTPEQKAEAFIKEEVKKTLFKPDTYDPIETKVDSAYTPYDDPTFYKEFLEFIELGCEYESKEYAIKAAKSDMSFYGGSFSNGFFKNQYMEAKERYEEGCAELEKIREKAQNKCSQIATKLQSKPEFFAWKVYHSYRANNNDGNTVISNYIIIVDKEIQNILLVLTCDEYKNYIESIKQVKEKFKEGKLFEKSANQT